MYLRILISRVTIDSRSTVSYIPRTLSELDDYMTSVNNNVTTFNEFVRLQLDTLTARGESPSNVMVNLFNGYLAALDKEFATYIKQKKNYYKEGQDLQECELMTIAENKFKSLICSGEWNAPLKEQKEILALSTKLESFTKNKKSEKQDKCKEKFEWKKEALKYIMDTKDKNGKTYHWCTKHKMWTLHKASEYKLESPKEDDSNKVEEEHKIQLKQALMAMEDDEESVKLLLILWFGKLLTIYISRMIVNKMCITDSWLNVSYHFIIYIYINSLISAWIKTIISRIKDRTSY